MSANALSCPTAILLPVPFAHCHDRLTSHFIQVNLVGDYSGERKEQIQTSHYLL